ncbi:unnamed protein product [Trichogramma brassicae]|uniref:Uncharacterized protein n=1 Tax=Trichogramma brassicae TaxID=86971 RepID=A0A6H5IMI8_9HYME|nr:unnamed protein product [Trichogramma brassicae]
MLKPSKPAFEPSSYHPLCMLDTAGKLLERIIADRLEAFTEGPAGLADSQFGFRKGRSTNDVIQKVLSTAKAAISGKRYHSGTKKYCVIVTLESSILQIFGGGQNFSARFIQRVIYRFSVCFMYKMKAPSRQAQIGNNKGPVQSKPYKLKAKYRDELDQIVDEYKKLGIVKGTHLYASQTELNTDASALGLAAMLFQADEKDDGPLVSDSPDGMRLLLRSAEDVATAVGLRFNPSKSATLHLKGAGTARVRDTRFSIQGSKMCSMREGEAYEHLGVPTGFQVLNTSSTITTLLFFSITFRQEFESLLLISILTPMQSRPGL